MLSVATIINIHRSKYITLERRLRSGDALLVAQLFVYGFFAAYNYIYQFLRIVCYVSF